MDSKILEVDKDEWIYHSMKRYSNLYMFELEFPVDAIEVIDDTSICVSGIQAFSKKCEILQLSIPPKLLTKDADEGLCKDRDFNMISGGYASGRILQIKPIKSFPSFVIAVEEGRNGITMFKFGDENCAVLKEQTKLYLPDSAVPDGKCPGVIDTHLNRIIMGASNGKALYEWNLENEFVSSDKFSVSEHTLSPSKDESLFGGITKLKFWDENTTSFCTDKGVVCIYDLRAGKPSLQCSVLLHGSKSPFKVVRLPTPQLMSLEAIRSTSTPVVDPAISHSEVPSSIRTEASSSEEIVSPAVEPATPPVTAFSFDTIPSAYKVGMVDSYGGYETFDIRMPSSALGRTVIPGFEKNSGIISQRFNIEYEPQKTGVMTNQHHHQFILTGLREDSVQVIREDDDILGEGNVVEGKSSGGLSSVKSVFTHDGHSKTVTHALWHPVAERLVFSASVDSMLHAWQFNCSDENK